MDAITPKPKRRSRTSTAPIIREDGTIYEVRERDLSDSDDRKIEILARYEGLTIPYIAGLSGEHPVAVQRRLRQMRCDPSLWVKVHDSQAEDPEHHYFEPLVYQLSYRSLNRCKDRAVFVDRTQFTGAFTHRLASCQVRADFDYGALKTQNVSIIPFEEMMTDARLPDATKQMTKPYLFPVTLYPKKSQPIERDVRFDCHPFIVKRPLAPRPYHLILGIEVDLGTERVKTLDYFKSYIRTKVIEDIAIFEADLPRQRFGFPAGHIIYVSPSLTRIKDIMAVVEEETADKPALRKQFLFTTYKMPDQDATPTGEMLTKEYMRVQYPPLKLTD